MIRSKYCAKARADTALDHRDSFDLELYQPL